MSRAFVKEDVDPPERSRRPRSASGLPPGATNYITSAGADRLREELANARKRSGDNAERINEMEQILASVTVVDSQDEPGKEVAFGTRVTVRNASGQLKSYRIVGVDELTFHPEALSWISPTGRILLAAELNQQVVLPEIGSVRIVKVEYPAE